MRLGVVGTGGMATQRAREFRKLGVCLAGAHSYTMARLETFSREIGAAPFVDYGQMLAAVDAVVICVPNNLHAILAREALV